MTRTFRKPRAAEAPSGQLPGIPAELPPLAVGRRVRVHYNLHKKNFSVIVAGRVAANVADITLTGVKFHVQPAGLARIRRERRRVVCAYATGVISAVGTSPDVAGMRRVTFNPFRADTFTCDGQPVEGAACAVFKAASAWTGPA